MKIYVGMKKKEETNNKYSCEFCNREFIRQSTVDKHICQYKHRWLEKDHHGNRIGYQSFIQFYKKNSANKKEKTYEEFIKSSYYTAFIKFGIYCVEIKAINIPRFLDWLIENQIKIDTWTSDSVYTKFLIEYLRTEDPYDAITRSVNSSMELAEDQKIHMKDILRYGNRNKICYYITLGKISPWMLYQSQSGIELLNSLDETQVKIIIDYINPELWAIKFKRLSDIVVDIKKLLIDIGY